MSSLIPLAMAKARLEPQDLRTSDKEWLAMLHREAAWELNADLTDAMILNGVSDREILADWSAYCRRRASEIRAQLQRSAESDANDVGTSW